MFSGIRFICEVRYKTADASMCLDILLNRYPELSTIEGKSCDIASITTP